MSPLTLTARKLLKLSGAAVVGTAVAAMFAAPAFAWTATLTPGTPKCTDSGTVTVKWTVHNKENSEARVFVIDHQPDASSVDVDNKGAKLPASGDLTITQTGVPSNTGGSLKIKVVWDGDHKIVYSSFEGVKCEKPSPSPSPSKSVGGGGGGEGTPTPSSTAVPPSLPVTGPNGAIYGGGAAALLVAGGTLFIVA